MAPSNPRTLAPPTSVARSLANAAAALRAQEWRDGNTRNSAIPISSTTIDANAAPQRNTYANPPNRAPTRWEAEAVVSYDAEYSYEEQENAMYDRAAFYEELRERHRNLTDRQRIAHEFYSKNLQKQQPQRENSTGETAIGYTPMQEPKRQRMDTSQVQEPEVAKHFRPSFSMRMDPMVQDATLTESPGSQIPQMDTLPKPSENNTPSVIEDVEEEQEDDRPSEKKQKKRIRYLRDTDRRNIIKRIENGEKQAALAREFGVTRAAICHIKKNRFEILSRYNMLVKSAQEMNHTDNFVGPPGVEMMVHEVRANSILLLMTILRDNRTNGVGFRRVAGRVIMILLEEALAIMGTESVEVVTGTGHVYRGLEMRHQFCGVAIGADGFPFLVLFHQMEPDAAQGSIHVIAETDRSGQRIWRLDHMDLPANIVQHKVLLFSSTCSTGFAELKAIEALCSIGCDERSISLVVMLAAADGIINVSNRFPEVHIITAGIDGKVDPRTDHIIPGFGDFVSRYNSS
ncbi:hypothetical protein PHMEG_00012750 [Phytophthora megakarya]|uniref:Uncharacterized protein n=1 Tax=Phytophthora megakarya TaxID=4795 RepID=A0A225WAK2_9STRA|nr:hypothetical protein PHMEG_00012750 [Phytophthora megakarya]